MLGQLSTSEPPSGHPSSPFSWGIGPRHPLRFRTRTEPVDWRRISALDVERVAREMDVGMLQEFISVVTFCDVSGERCPHCRNPAEPALLKVLQMSQLSTEYLLHCQDYLKAQVSGLEDQLQGALSRAVKESEDRARLDAELQATRQESRRRKKMISSQQLLLQASSNNYHKCHCCEKSFVNYSYLQAHLQRRHPEVTDAEREKKKQVQQMEDGIEELRERLKLAQSKLEAEREVDALKRQQDLDEQRRKEAAEREMLENWKEEERRKFQEEMRDFRQLFLQEFKEMSNRSSSIETKLQELQTREVTVSNLGSFQDVDELQKKDQELKVKLAQQKSEWRTKFKDIQNQHLLEKEELQEENERLKHSLSASHSSALQKLQQQVSSLSSQTKQKDRLIRSQEEKIKKLSARPRPVQETAVQRSVQQSTAAQLEVEEESEEEEQELEDPGETRRRLLESLRRNPGLVREFRPILEETLEEKLENMGLRKGTKGISQKTFKSLSALVSGQRQLKSRQVRNLLSLRESLASELARRVQRLQKNQNTFEPAPQAQKRSRHGSPSRGSSPKRRHTPGKPSPMKTEKIQVTQSPQAAVARQQKSRTPPFSSDEESVEDSAYVTSPGSRSAPSVSVIRSGPRPPLTSVPATDDWSDSEPSEGPAPPTPHHDRRVQGAVVKSLTRSLERQLSSPGTKPVGGTRVMPPAAVITPKPRATVRHLQLSDEESDLELSSIEEILPLPAGGVLHGGRGSMDIGGTSGTSVWSSSNSRVGGL